MAKQTKTEQALIQLSKIESKQLVEVSKWEKSQKQIIKDHPFVKIVDTATYQEAKANRTALLKGRTALLGANGQEGTIRSAFKNLLTGSIVILKELASITEPHYEAQQEEVKRYEAVIDEKRQEKIRLQEEERLKEETRIKEINNKIENMYNDFKVDIDKLEFDGIGAMEERFEVFKETADVAEFGEFEVTFYKMLERLDIELIAKVQTLTTSENQRLEHIRLKEEREKFEEEKRIDEEKKAKEQAKIDAENKKIADENRRIADELKEKEGEIAKEKQRLIDAEEARLEKIRTEKLAKQITIKNEKIEKQKIADAKAENIRLKKLMPDKKKAQSIVDSLNFEIINSIKDKEVKSLINDFATDVSGLMNDYTNAIKNLK